MLPKLLSKVMPQPIPNEERLVQLLEEYMALPDVSVPASLKA